MEINLAQNIKSSFISVQVCVQTFSFPVANWLKIDKNVIFKSLVYSWHLHTQMPILSQRDHHLQYHVLHLFRLP